MQITTMLERKLSEAAAAGMILTIKCDLCRRSVHFWAADLVKILGPHYPLSKPPWLCSQCRTADYLHVRYKVWTFDELRNVTVRRPVKKITKWVWRNERA
jgi:hypothetical protein